jgi:hypothetical protein
MTKHKPPSQGLEEIRALKRRHRRLEKKLRENEAKLYPWVAPFPSLWADPPKKAGRPKKTKWEIEASKDLVQVQLIKAIRGLSLRRGTSRDYPNKSAIAKKLHNKKFALLRRTRSGIKAPAPRVGYLRTLVADAIHFAETKLGPVPPGREGRSRHNRALDLICGDETEIASHLKKSCRNN